MKAFLEERLAFAVSAGIREGLICLDPGIGFGKQSSTTQSWCGAYPSWLRSGGPW